MEVIDMKKLKWEMRKKQVVEGVTEKAKKLSNLCRENKEVLVVAIPTGAAVIRSASRMIGSFARGRAVKSEERDRKTRFYDHRLGHYWYTRRPLKPDELLYVQKRRSAGEPYGDIFASMNYSNRRFEKLLTICK